MSKIKTAVLPVAGLGTRVLPATKSIPKEMLPIIDRPAIQYVVDEAREAGIEHFVFVTGRNKGAIEDYFDVAYELMTILEQKSKTGVMEKLESSLLPAGSASFVRQQSPQGLGHAVWCARDVVGNDPFAVLLPDVVLKGSPSCLAQLVDVYGRTGGNVIAVDRVPMDEVSSYGVIAPKSENGRLIEMSGMVEKPPVASAPSNLKITGRYILQPEIFDLLEKQGPGAGNEIQLTDAMETLMQSQAFHAYEFEGVPYDCGSVPGYFEAVLGFGADREDTAPVLEALLKRMADKA